MEGGPKRRQQNRGEKFRKTGQQKNVVRGIRVKFSAISCGPSSGTVMRRVQHISVMGIQRSGWKFFILAGYPNRDVLSQPDWEKHVQSGIARLHETQCGMPQKWSCPIGKNASMARVHRWNRYNDHPLAPKLSIN